MEGELQELRDLVAQLRAENDRLQREQAAAVPGPSAAHLIPAEPHPTPSTTTAPVPERLVLVPRDKRCPVFRGRSGIGLEEWIKEAEACMRARHLSTFDRAFFLFDHLEGEAREEIKFRSAADRSDPIKIIAILRELYGSSDSYVALQEAFFSRRQHDGETLQEFPLALMSLMSAVKQSAPSEIPNADVLLSDKVPCLVDTGSMVSTIRESFFRQHFETWGLEKLKSCHWLQLQAANGLPIPYLGYLELEVELCGRTLPECGLLVVKDPPDGASSPAPGVLGMNILRRCYSTLFGQHGPALFNLHTVTEAPTPVVQAFQRRHQASLSPVADVFSKVKLRGKKACRIFGGSMQLVPATCSFHRSGTCVIFEPSERGLPAGLLSALSNEERQWKDC